MNTIFKSILLVITFFVISCNSNAQHAQKESVSSGTKRIEVLYFHSQHRCTTCLNIEKYTKETLFAFFDKEIKEGKITFTLLNADDPKNKVQVEKYQVYGSTLLLNVVINGKGTVHDMTDFAFLNSDNREKFMALLKQKVEEQLATF